MHVLEEHRDGLAVETPAKINVGLRVLGRRPDGYHEIESLVMAVGLTDRLEARPTDDGSLSLEVVPQGAEAPSDDSNLILKAAKMLRAHAGGHKGARITLVKRIPAARGLGGGSSDGAAALVVLARLWGLRVASAALRAMAADLGSDVPFFLGSPLAVIRGRGEIIEPRPAAANVWIVLLCPPFGLSTGEVYQSCKPPLTRPRAGVKLWEALLVHGHLDELGRQLTNDLEPAAQAICGKMSALRTVLRKAGASCISMTGSGSAMYALAARREDAQRIAEGLDAGPGAAVHVVAPWTAGERSTR